MSETDCHRLYTLKLELWMLITIVIGFQSSFFNLKYDYITGTYRVYSLGI